MDTFLYPQLNSPRYARPEEVFTPRSDEVNRRIYMTRPDLEEELTYSLRGSMNLVIYGESGAGKSWLFKKVADDLDCYYLVANAANALRFGSLTAELKNLAEEHLERDLSKTIEEKSALADALFAKGSLGIKKEYSHYPKEPLMACFELIRQQAGHRKAVLVVDNVEQIFDRRELMDELGSLLILLDDHRYAKHNVAFVLIGVPSGIRSYFSRSRNQSTISNRLEEIAEVTCLSDGQVHSLMYKGFVELIGIDIGTEIFNHWADHVSRISLGVPQAVHEYCLQLAFVLESNAWVPTAEMVSVADKRWLSKGMEDARAVVESFFPPDRKPSKRAMEVLVALAQIESEQFSAKELEGCIRQRVIEYTADSKFSIKPILNRLSGTKSPLLVHDESSRRFRFAHPRFRMYLRARFAQSGTSRLPLNSEVSERADR